MTLKTSEYHNLLPCIPYFYIRLFVLSQNPVSYTHLDVYKRQSMNCAAGRGVVYYRVLTDWTCLPHRDLYCTNNIDRRVWIDVTLISKLDGSYANRSPYQWADRTLHPSMLMLVFEQLLASLALYTPEPSVLSISLLQICFPHLTI